MAVSYNLTQIVNTTTFLGLTQNVNTYLMHGYLGVSLLLGIMSMLFMGFYFGGRSIPQCFVATSYIMLILTVAFRVVSLVDDWVLFPAIILCAIALAVNWKT